MSSTVLGLSSIMTLDVTPDLRLRDLARIQARLAPELRSGVRRVCLRGATTMTEGVRMALMATQNRMQREGVELVLESG